MQGLTYDVYVNGGRAKVEGREAVAWAREATERGAGEVLLTSMDRDGTTDGYDLELTRAVADAVAVPVIASGGVGELAHLVEGITEGGADAVLAASIFHYGSYTIGEAKARHAGRRDPGPSLRTGSVAQSTSRSTLTSVLSTEARVPGVSAGSICASTSPPVRMSSSVAKKPTKTAVPCRLVVEQPHPGRGNPGRRAVRILDSLLDGGDPLGADVG